MIRYCLALLAAVAVTPASADDHAVVDAAGRNVIVTDTSRIVSIGGAVTEILYALGMEDRIVAVDLTSDFPRRTHEKANIGYMRTLSAEGVLSVNPSLIIAIDGSGPKEAIDVLKKASVPFVLVPEAHDAAGVVAKIRFVADAVGAHDKGAAIANDVAADLATVSAAIPPVGERRKAVFVLSMGAGAPLVAGGGTAAADIFALAGIDNALTGFAGYKAASEEAALAASPDAIVMMAERSGGTNPDAVFAATAFAASPAARDRRLVALPGEYMLGFGPRTASAVRDLAAAIYPERSIPVLPPRPWATDTP